MSKEESIEAIKWFIEEKMNWTDEEILNHWRARFIAKHGIKRFVVAYFDNNMYRTINAVYPGRFERI